jgi:FkbM family methyltransferase
MSDDGDFEREQRRLFLTNVRRGIGFFLRLVRKLLWPFLRPLAYRVGALEANARADEILKLRVEELLKLVPEHALMRGELAALKNRFAMLNALDDRMTQLESRVARPRELVITTSKDTVFIAKPGEIISDHIIGGAEWDEHVVSLAREAAKSRKGSAVDVGAHLGSTTLVLARLFDAVYSFEPNDFNYKLLRANVAINGLDNVSLFNTALYSRAVELSLADDGLQELCIPRHVRSGFDGHAGVNLGAFLFTERGTGLSQHLARTLDSFELSNVAFVKIDAQGADGEVLMGALQTLERCRPVVVFEWESALSERFTVTLDAVRRHLADLGYEVSVLKAHNEKQVDYVARPASASPA